MIKPRKAYIITIAGGRAGNGMNNYTIDLTDLNLNDEDTVEELFEGEYTEYNSLEPNHDADRKRIIEVLKGIYVNDRWVGWDVFGEGVIGFTTQKILRPTLAKEVREMYNGVSDDLEWED